LAEIDLEALSLDELKRLQKDVAKAIDDFEARRQREAIAAVEEKARELGFTFAELAAAAPAKKTGGAKSPPKYQHPENPSITWTGKGRQPAWIKEALEAGKSLDDFLIGS
jgi:DNA-binding protein H-NS